MNSNLSRGHFLAAASSAAMIPQILAKPDPGKMKAGTAKVDITPDRPRYTLPGAYTGHPETLLLDPPSVYHPVHARCLTSMMARAVWCSSPTTVFGYFAELCGEKYPGLIQLKPRRTHALY